MKRGNGSNDGDENDDHMRGRKTSRSRVDAESPATASNVTGSGAYLDPPATTISSSESQVNHHSIVSSSSSSSSTSTTTTFMTNTKNATSATRSSNMDTLDTSQLSPPLPNGNLIPRREQEPTFAPMNQRTTTTTTTAPQAFVAPDTSAASVKLRQIHAHHPSIQHHHHSQFGSAHLDVQQRRPLPPFRQPRPRADPAAFRQRLRNIIDAAIRILDEQDEDSDHDQESRTE